MLHSQIQISRLSAKRPHSSKAVRHAACFVVAAAMICAVANAEELRRRGMLGVQLGPVTQDMADSVGLDAPRGVMIGGTFPDTPAAESGLQQGDILLTMNGDAIPDVGGFIRMVENYYAKDKLTFDVQRNDQKLNLSFVLGERPRETSDDFDVIYDSAVVDGTPLRTIITKPRTAGKMPAVLFIPDLTPQSLDFWAPSMSSPQRSLLYGLSDAGLVTMRVDLPGIGDSRGDHARDADLPVYVDSYAAALQKLREYDFVDPQRVFIYAERLGSVAAPMVCQKTPAAGIITYGGMGRNYIESRLADTRRHNHIAQGDPSQNNDIVRAMALFMSELCLAKKTPQQIMKDHPDLEQLGGMLVQNEKYLIGHHYKFFQTLGSLDPAAAWRGLDTKVLVLFGEADWVSGREDSQLLAETINWERRRATFKEVPNTDALYLQADTAEDSFLAGNSGGEFSQEIVKAVKDFIAATKPRAS